MPSGPPELHEKWGGDGPALDHLRRRGYTNKRGVIRPPEGHDETPEDASAILYLRSEWDYSYDPSPEVSL